MIVEKEITEDMKNLSGAALSGEDQVIFDQVQTAVAAAEDKKAQQISVLRLSAITEFTDYFIICTGNSTRQTQAIADEVVDKLKSRGVRPLNTEGYNSAEWILIDYGVFVFHVFTESSRRFYDLERLWHDAERIVLSPESH